MKGKMKFRQALGSDFRRRRYSAVLKQRLVKLKNFVLKIVNDTKQNLKIMKTDPQIA